MVICIYDICAVCFWEDDGISEKDKYSYPNRMSLKEARLNFKEVGAMHAMFFG
ncbi:CPCC family cysteine-rich protein [Chitinophaga arvensicola]|uniref:CPCC family cysteine-rich protein n=1 Tax=Chitinophaga arvensicola TaxID=29529 RepID=UPI000B7DE7E0